MILQLRPKVGRLMILIGENVVIVNMSETTLNESGLSWTKRTAGKKQLLAE